MKILDLTEKKAGIYTSNVYFVLGSFNRIPDKNTLIDVGADPALVERINRTSTGFGKKRVEQVILTHHHTDHIGALAEIRRAFKPVVYAFDQKQTGADQILKDGDTLQIGDRMFEVIRTPSHTKDSICLYCETDGVLFVGDTSVIINSAYGKHEHDLVMSLKRLCTKDVKCIYPGHGEPLLTDCNRRLNTSLANVRQAREHARDREGQVVV